MKRKVGKKKAMKERSGGCRERCGSRRCPQKNGPAWDRDLLSFSLPLNLQGEIAEGQRLNSHI